MSVPATAVCDCGRVFRADAYESTGRFMQAVNQHRRKSGEGHRFERTGVFVR
jgi:hypothetical protein